jgi:hypothetical protein
MTSNHKVMTVGPMIVRILEASVDSPADAWINPAPMEPRPAPNTTQPSHRGKTRLRATARPNRMKVTPAKTKLNRLASAKLIVSLAWTTSGTARRRAGLLDRLRAAPFLWCRLRPAVREMNYASRRMTELQMRLP